jgi:Cdc6-like AAA superfamily ATPase
MANIIIRNYEHINRSLPNWNTPTGRYIRNKDEYDRAMKESGMVSYEVMQQRAAENKNKESKYVPSNRALGIVRHAIEKADKKGNVKLDERAIDALKRMNALKPKPKYVPKVTNSAKGGFYEK